MALSRNSYPDIQYVPTVVQLKSVPGPRAGTNNGNPFTPDISDPLTIENKGKMPFYPTEGVINAFSPSPSNFPAQQFLDIRWFYPQDLPSKRQYPPYNTLELEGIVFASAAATTSFFGKYTFVWDYVGGIDASHFTRPDMETYAGITDYFDVATSYGEFLYANTGNNTGWSYYRVFMPAYTNGFLQVNFKYTFI